uniref:non-specific serine/threonine protein kinase n=1 Tax=Brassica campestris TaxID=3711 RepID=M4EU49_BRACM
MMQDVDVISNPDTGNSTIRCDCSFNKSTTCHITSMHLTSNQFTGSLPNSLAKLMNLEDLVSDNNFNGTIPEYIGNWSRLQRLILRNVSLSGAIPSYIWSLPELKTLDLSFNSLTGEVRGIQSAPKFTTGLLPCAGPINCTSYQRTLHINCGGQNTVIKNSSHKISYEADDSTVYSTTNQHFKTWGISNTGVFAADEHSENDTYIILASSKLPGDSPNLYKTARRSALSLVYYAFCLENGEYNLKLHFMEIQFSDEEPFSRLGRRIFDVYVQGELFLKDFNIKEESNGTMTPVVKEVKAVNVTNHMLEIQLYWAGKGTTLIPKRGNYGPLISAISLCHHNLRVEGLPTVCFTWRQLQAATNNFDQANKLGEGGFGSVFKGELSDGTIIAVKQLSSKSHQVNREFVNDIGMISGLNHPNLVKLYGCCVEKNQLMLVYEYMENNSLAHMLHGKSSLNLNWRARQKICVGIARGLEFLHEGSMIRMVHRDIKTTNVLLDADLNAKISDFGLARLHEEEHSHISTKIAGTIGYMAPEYALWGQLSEKADVYSFGIVAMEIVSGQSNTKQKGSADHVSLINWAVKLQQKGDITEIVDPVLQGDFNTKEAVRMIKVAIVCTNSSPSLRPTMSEVVQMLEGEVEITQVLSDPGLYGHNWSISNLRDIDTDGGLSTSVVTDQTATRMKSSVSGCDLYPLYPESMILNSTVDFSSSSL